MSIQKIKRKSKPFLARVKTVDGKNISATFATRSEAEEYQQQRLRKVRAEAALAEHELQVAKREVVPMAEAVDFIEQKLSPIAIGLRSLPSRLGVLCVGIDDAREAESVIAREVDKCLKKIRGE